MNDTNLRVKLSQTNIACTITKDQLRNLAELLQERANTAAKLEIESLEADEGVDPTQLEKNKKTLAESFTLKFTVFGADGNQLFGTLKDVFDSPNFPEHLVSLFVQSDLTLRAAHNYYPRNSFRLSLDFTRPALFNFDFLPSQRTPNTSSFDVEGYDVSWANGLFSEITRFFESKRSSLAVLHKHTVYDLLLWLIGIPATFWILL